MSSNALSYAVHVNEGKPTTNGDLPPDLDVRMWSPTSTTVIYGDHEALVVDPAFLFEHTAGLLRWIEAEQFRITKAYITHGHGDHWFGLGAVLNRYPEAEAFTRPEVMKEIELHASAAVRQAMWDNWFPGQIPESVVFPLPMQGNVLTVDGAEVRSIPLGHTDGDDTSCLHVPDLGLVVAGDAVYNNVHLMLAGSDAEGRRSWLRALDTLEALNPTSIVAGHKDPEKDDDPRQIEDTRRYILDFERGLASTTSVIGLYEFMLDLYPTRINHGALWGSCQAAHA